MLPNEAALSARPKVERLLVDGAALMRALQLAAGLPVLFGGGLGLFRSATLAVGAYLLAVAWSALLFGLALRRGRVKAWWIYADVALSSMWLLMLPQMCVVEQCASGWQWWVVPPAMGSAILAVFFIPLPFAAVGTLIIELSYVAGTWRHLTTSQEAIGNVLMNSFFLFGFAVLAAIAAYLLRGFARRIDEAAAEALGARAREAAAQARYEERNRQFDALHHTVLSTLSKIARGGLDHRADEVRALCARDAEYLRALVTGVDADGMGDFVSSLASVVRDKQALGLKVHSQFHSLPSVLPAGVSPALLGAAREALANVAKHAGTDEAWLTAVGVDDGLRMVVVDRGAGFEPEKVVVGRGLMRELRHNIIEVGGAVTITSDPGHGTVVDVRWQS